MGLFEDVLLTVDYDRTLTDANSEIPERNLEAIRYFMENGGAFTVNTGRSLPQSAIIREKVPMNTDFLACNGSACLENGELAHLRPIELPIEETLRAVCEAFPELNVDLHGAFAHYGFQPRGCWEDYCAAHGFPYALAKPGTDYGPFLKFNVYGKLHDTSMRQMYSGAPEELALIDRAETWLRDTYGDKLTVIRSLPRVINVHAPGVSKLRAARDLQARLGRKILVCVGDEENDLAMLEGADYAFSPAGSPMAERFPAVCPCEEGAVADVIYEKIPEILKG